MSPIKINNSYLYATVIVFVILSNCTTDLEKNSKKPITNNVKFSEQNNDRVWVDIDIDASSGETSYYIDMSGDTILLNDTTD